MCQVVWIIYQFYESVVKRLIAEFTSFFERNPLYVASADFEDFSENKKSVGSRRIASIAHRTSPTRRIIWVG